MVRTLVTAIWFYAAQAARSENLRVSAGLTPDEERENDKLLNDALTDHGDRHTHFFLLHFYPHFSVVRKSLRLEISCSFASSMIDYI